MDEQVIQDLYNRAVSLGYGKSKEQFVSLLQSDSSVQDDNYAYVKSQGYQKSMNDFLGLVGVGVAASQSQDQLKKKEESVTTGSPLAGSSSVSKSLVSGAIAAKKIANKPIQKSVDQPISQPIEQDLRALDNEMPSDVIRPKQNIGVALEKQTVADTVGREVNALRYKENSPRTSDGFDVRAIELNENSPVTLDRLNAENARKEYNKSLISDYVNYLWNTGEQDKANNIKEQFDSISTDLTGASASEYRTLVTEAQAWKNRALSDNISTLNFKYGIKDFYKDNASNYGELARIDQMLRSNIPQEQRMELEAKRQALGGMIASSMKERGIPIEALSEYENAQMQYANEAQAYNRNTGYDLAIEEADEARGREIKRDWIERTMAGSNPILKGVAVGYNASEAFADTVLESVVSIAQTPKVIGDIFGDSDYDWADKMYQGSKYAKERIGSEIGNPYADVTEDAPTYVSLSRLFGNAAGSMATMAAGGQLGQIVKGTQAAARVGRFSTTMLMQMADNYEDALAQGMSQQEAALFGTWSSILSAMVEQIVPEGAPAMNTMRLRDAILKGARGQELARVVGKSIEEYAQNAGKEMGEEIFEQYTSDINKVVFGYDPSEVFNMKNYTDAALSGLMLGGAMTAFRGPRKNPQMIAEAMYDMASVPSDQLPTMSKEDAKAHAEMSTLLRKLEMSPDWGAMDRDARIIAFDKAREAYDLEQEKKTTGVALSISEAYSKNGFTTIADSEFEYFRQAANDSKIEQAYEAKLKEEVTSGSITIEEAKESLNNYRRSVGLYRSVPDGLSAQQAKEAMNLLKEKKDLEQQIAGKDEALVKRQKTRIAEINESLNKISENAVQESSTEGVLPRQQGEAAEAGGERGQMGQGVQGQETAQASTQERVGVLSSPETISAALEQLPTEERVTGMFIQEDGTETPIMGNERMLADLYAIATELSEQERTPQQKSVIDAVEVSLKTLIEEEAQGQQEQIMPDDEITSLVDDEIYVFTAPAMEQVPEQFRESAEVVPAREVKYRKRFLGLVPYGKETITTSDEIVRYRATGRQAKAAYAQIVAANPQMRPEIATTKATIAQNVAKSVASIFPNLKITTHRNGDEMRSFAEKNFGAGVSTQVLGDEGGMIIYDANNNPVAIMINDDIADATTMPHEAWHGILIKAFGQDENLFTEFRDNIKKRLIDNGFTEIADQLDEFSQTEEYQQSNSQAEEWLAQFGGLLTASGITADNLTPKAKTLLQQIKDVFNDVARKITGSPIFLEDATPDDILDFMVTISDRMRRGETIADFFRGQQQEEQQKDGKNNSVRASAQKVSVKESIGNASEEYVNKKILPYIVDVYGIQDSTAERILERSFKPNRVWVYKIENAGDIIRELSKYKNTFLDPSYIYEKVNKIESFLKSQQNQLLVAAEDSYYQFKRQNEKAVEDFVKAYEDLPVVSEAQSVAKKMVLDLLNGDIPEAQKGIDYFNEIRKADDIKTELMSKNEYDIAGQYYKAKKEGYNPNLVKSIEDLIENQLRISKQGNSSDSGVLSEVKKIATRYNINNQGFAPRQVDEKALARELAPLGYSAKRSKPTADGYGGGVFITNARGVFFNPFKAKKQRPRKSAMLETDPTTIEGYDNMVKNIDGIIKKSRDKGRSNEETVNSVIRYMQGSLVYERATDIQREAMVRGIRKQFGLKESPSPSVAKTLGTLKDVNKITMSEKELLKKQFRDQARGARDAKKAWMLASKELAKGIKELRGKGKVSIAQAANIISRFSKVNVFDQESIDRFVNYMVNIIQDAQYSEKISRAKSLLPRARKNIKTKIGDAQEVAQDLKKLFAIDPSMIPLQYIDTYISMLESFGGKTAVLDLKDISTVASDVSSVLNEIDNEVSIAEEMAERFAYADKVYDDDGNLLYAETVSEMLEQGEITSKEADIMRKYRSIISPVVRTQKTEQEIEQEKARTISAISRMAIDPANLALEDEVALAKKIAPLLKPALLNRLPLSKLENIARLIENINNGYMPHFGALVYERLASFENSIEAVQSVKEAKPIKLSKMYASLKSKLTGKGAILEMIRRSPLYFLDQVFGDFKSKRLFNSLFKGMAEGNDLFRASIDAINKRLDNAHDAVAKSRGYEINETIMSSYRMMAYMLQNEYLSNPGSDQVKPAMDYLKKTIEVLESEGTKTATRKAETLQEIVNNYSTGSDIDMKKLFDSFNSAELEAIETITDINNELSEKAVYTAAVIRGKRIDPLVNYVHHIAIPEIKLGEIDSATQMANQYNASISPSSRAMNLQDRKNKVVPLNFDVFASAQRGAKFTLLDYHMTMPIRIARKTINQMRADIKESGSTAEQKRIVNALDSAVDEVISNVLTNNFITDSFVEKALNFVSKQGYRAVLASAPRFASELTSNMAFAMILDRKSFSKGVKYGGFLMSEDAVAFMKNVKSKMTTRLYHGNTLGGRLIDQSILSQTSGVKSAEPVGDIQNVANMIYNISLKKYKNFVEVVADSLISTPDKMVMRPAWFGSFATEFNRQTGKDPDMEKISSGDQEYMSTYADAIEAAKTFADDRSVTVGAADNPFMGILKGTIKPNQNALVKGFNNFNNYMTRFTIYEYIAARQGIYAAMGNGSISRRDGAAMLAAVVTRMTVYSMLTSLLGSAMLSMFADEDEEDEKTIMQKFGQALASTMSSLIVGRDFGNATKSMLSYGVEEINDEVLTDLRNGEYDPYKDAITFSPFPKKKKLDIGDILVSASGSYSTSLKTLDLMVKKMLEEPKKEKDAIERSENETNVRIPLELLGNMGMVPLYKDIRKIVMDQMYKDLENAEKKSADKKQAEKEMLRGYENKTDMKRYDPKLYDEVFGKGSPTYKEDQAKKKIKKEKEDLKRRMKDDFYDYVPKKSKQSGFGSDEFGSDKFESDKFGK